MYSICSLFRSRLFTTKIKFSGGCFCSSSGSNVTSRRVGMIGGNCFHKRSTSNCRYNSDSRRLFRQFTSKPLSEKDFFPKKRAISSLQTEGTSESKKEKSGESSLKPVTILDIQKKYKKGEKLSMVTAYDYSSAQCCDNAKVDMILVGDSLGMVIMGLSTTVPVTLSDIIYHSRIVRRGTKRAYLFADLPFGTYLTVDDALHSAARLIQEGRVDAVKIEGGRKMGKQIRAIVDCGISVVGHIGLTPQTASALGGFRVQGKTASVAIDLYRDALALQNAGCSMIILECVPSSLASYITKHLSIPTIGIGAGCGTSGQVQVYHDMIGLFNGFTPKFTKRFVEIGKLIEKAVSEYRFEVENQSFPNESQSFSMKDEQFQKFIKMADRINNNQISSGRESEEENNEKYINQSELNNIDSQTAENLSLYGSDDK